MAENRPGTDPPVHAPQKARLGTGRSVPKLVHAADGDADQRQGEADHDHDGSPGDDVETARIDPFAHDVHLVDQQHHEDEDEGQQDAVEHLREQNHLHQRETGDQDDAGAHHDQQGIEPVEDGRVFHPLADAGLEAEALADGIGGGQGQNAGRENGGVEQPGAEQQKGIFAEGLEAEGGFGGILDIAWADGVDGAGTGHDDEEGDHRSHETADDHLDARLLVLLGGDAFFHHGRLQVELHPGRDGGAHHADQHIDVAGFEQQHGLHAIQRGFLPIGFDQESGDDVGDVEDAGEEEDLLDALVVAFDHQEPDREGGQRDGDVAADVEQLERTGHAGEFGHHVGQVSQHQDTHQQEGDAQAELFADEVGEALAGDGAHAGTHLLDDDERHGNGHQSPQGQIAVAGAGGGIGVDAAGIVIDDGGDEAGPNDGEEDRQVVAEALDEFPHSSLLP